MNRARSVIVWTALLAVFAIGLQARLTYINRPMMRDEAVTVIQFALEPARTILTDYREPNNHILHTLLVHGCLRTIGRAPWMVRLPALIAGLALIPAVFLLGREFRNSIVGLLAAALVASNSVLVEFSANARSQMLVALMAVLAAWQAHRAKRGAGLGAWVGFAIGSVLGFACVPIMLYPFGAIVLWLAGSAALGDVPNRMRRPFLLRLTLATLATLALTGLFYLPALLTIGLSMATANSYVAPVGFWKALYGLSEGLPALWRTWHRDVPAWLAVAVLALAAIGLVARWFDRSRNVLPLFACVIVFALGFSLIRTVVPPARNWLVLLPFYFLSTAEGLAAVLLLAGERVRRVMGTATRRTRSPANKNAGLTLACAAIAAIAFSGYEAWRVVHSGRVVQSYETGRFLGGEAIADRLVALLQPGDVVVATDNAQAVTRYYAWRHGVSPDIFLRRPPAAPAPRTFFIISKGEDIRQELALRSMREQPTLILATGDGELYRLTPTMNVEPFVTDTRRPMPDPPGPRAPYGLRLNSPENSTVTLMSS